MNEGRKDDHDKDPWHLAPWDSFRCIVKVLMFGANNTTHVIGKKEWSGHAHLVHLCVILLCGGKVKN